MGWVRVDDDFYDHPKFVDLSLAGMGLWVGLLAWSNRNLRDGCIPHSIPTRLGARQDDVQELLEAGLLDEGNDCLVIHDYHDFQPSKDEVEAKRDELAAKRAEAGRKGAASRWQTDSKPIANACPQPQPQHLSTTDGEPSKRRRTTPIPEAFTVDESMQAWALAECPGLDWDRETRKFVDWSKANDARKADWRRTWQGWMRRAHEGAFR